MVRTAEANAGKTVTLYYSANEEWGRDLYARENSFLQTTRGVLAHQAPGLARWLIKPHSAVLTESETVLRVDG